MFESLFIPFLAITAAELLDKSQLSIVLLSSRTKKHFQLLLGVLLAFAIVDGIAIIFGSFVAQVIPEIVLKLASSFIFILFGVIALLSKENNRINKLSTKTPFLSGFLLIFISEWGDKSQIASAVFGATMLPVFVFLGVMSALTLFSILAVYIGKFFGSQIKSSKLGKISGVLFILLGILTLFF